MVFGRVIEGRPDEIAREISQITGERRVKVVLMEEAQASEAPRMTDAEFEKAMAELHAMAVSAPHADDSREAIYTRQPGE